MSNTHYTPATEDGFLNTQLYSDLKNGNLQEVRAFFKKASKKTAVLQALAIIRLRLRLGDGEEARASVEAACVALMQQVELS
jgi:hypothetical protein